MSNNPEKVVIENFLKCYKTLPEFSNENWVDIREYPVGSTNYGNALPKQIDLVLVQTNYTLATLNGLKKYGFKLSNRSKGYLDFGEEAWLVEAKSDIKKLWEAIGQSIGYKILFEKQTGAVVKVKGNFIIYPANQGEDKIIEKVILEINKRYNLNIKIVGVPCNNATLLTDSDLYSTDNQLKKAETKRRTRCGNVSIEDILNYEYNGYVRIEARASPGHLLLGRWPELHTGLTKADNARATIQQILKEDPNAQICIYTV